MFYSLSKAMGLGESTSFMWKKQLNQVEMKWYLFSLCWGQGLFIKRLTVSLNPRVPLNSWRGHSTYLQSQHLLTFQLFQCSPQKLASGFVQSVWLCGLLGENSEWLTLGQGESFRLNLFARLQANEHPGVIEIPSIQVACGLWNQNAW